MTWLLFAVGSAFFAGITSILAKIGIEDVDSDLATAIRTTVVLVFTWLMVAIVGSAGQTGAVSARSWTFIILSGLATGASWLCYFKALQLGNVNKVAPIDKSSTILTIILAFIFFHETVSFVKVVGVIAIGIGTLMMITKKKSDKKSESGWLWFALGSALFASLTALFGKMGVENVESNLATALRTIVVLIVAWAMVFMKGEQKTIKSITRKSWLFLFLSGLATGLSWLCYYRALQIGPASAVVPIDKLSILVTIVFSYFWLHEKLSKTALAGLVLLTAGTLAMVL